MTWRFRNVVHCGASYPHGPECHQLGGRSHQRGCRRTVMASFIATAKYTPPRIRHGAARGSSLNLPGSRSYRGKDHAGDQPAFASDLVDDVKRGRDAVRGVDHDRDDGYVTAQLREMIAVRRPIAAKAPDATVSSRAADLSGPEPPHDGAVDGLAFVLGRFGGVDRDLLPEREAIALDSIDVGGPRPRWLIASGRHQTR
jgi:hypothetical protein